MARVTQRIVSLVPSDTYTLLRLGVGRRLVGRTEYCIEPHEEVGHIEVVGGTKNADVARILELKPDLVVANQEENRRKDIDDLRSAGVEVLLSFPKTVAEGLDHAERLADVVQCGDRDVLAAHRATVERLQQCEVEPVPCFVPIWMDPLMTVNAGTFISDVLELCGGRNVFSDRERRYPLSADLGLRAPVPSGDRDTRYPRVTLAEVEQRAPQVVLLPDEPHEFSEADRAVFAGLAIPAAKQGKVRFCDGKDLMWYGLRAVEGLERIRRCLSSATWPNRHV